jgi:hypothetical protein
VSTARAAVVGLLRAEREWRKFFKTRCEEGVSRLWASSYEFRAELQKRGEWHEREEIGDVLLALAREKLPDSPAAQWDAEWASKLCKDALARLGEYYACLGEDERDRLDLSGQEDHEDAMIKAGHDNDPAAFRVALKEWERVGLEGLEGARERDGAA